MKLKIAVVGGGIFGVTIAWMLAKDGFSVDLFEKREDIFTAASGINQYRLHRGYHYPRSKETIISCIQGEKEFCAVYPEAILNDNITHYYCIAKEGSFVTKDHCKKIFDSFGLEYEIVDLDIVNKNKIEASFEVKEYLFDPFKMKELCWEKLKKYNVNVLLNKEATEEELEEYDLIVIATYSLNNSLLKKYPNAQKNYQFELCEKLILKLPEKFSKKSVVVVDGPFMCMDPFGRTGLFAMGNVVHAIHKRSIGKLPEIPSEYKNLIDQGVIKNPPITNFNAFINSAKEYLPGIEKAEHIGSMFTIRTVLPYREHDDARPTIVEHVGDKTIVVFSGKIPTCIDAAEQVLHLANNKYKKNFQDHNDT